MCGQVSALQCCVRTKKIRNIITFSAGGWQNKWQQIHKLEYYTTVKRSIHSSMYQYGQVSKTLVKEPNQVTPGFSRYDFWKNNNSTKNAIYFLLIMNNTYRWVQGESSGRLHTKLHPTVTCVRAQGLGWASQGTSILTCNDFIPGESSRAHLVQWTLEF